MDQTNFSEDAPMQSRFNSATFKIYRLNNCWSNVNKHWREADFQSMNWELDIIWSELWCDATKDHKEIVENINKSVKKAKNKEQFINALVKKWHFLFEVEKDQGLGKSYYDPEEYSLV